MPAKRTIPIGEHFWSKVDRSGVCWLWTGHRKANGYGQFFVNRQPVYAHRTAFELTYGPMLPGMVVMHLCDNPPCCNPAHLRAGSVSDNVQDARRKGLLASGDRHYAVKLTDAQVAALRDWYRAFGGWRQGERVMVARVLGITVNHLSNLATGYTREAA